MKRILILTCVAAFLSGLSVFASGVRHQIISDVDDTVKATHVGSPLSAAFNGVFKNQGFVGMPALLQGMATNADLTFISGSPESLGFKINYFLQSRHFPKYKLILRDWFRETNQSAFKMNHLEELARRSPEPFILIGDDTEADPDIYAEFAANHPGRVSAIYIHRITGRPIPETQRPFYSAFDIAAWEYSEGRLSVSGVEQTAWAIMDPVEDTQLIPSYGVCPDRVSSELAPPSLDDHLGLLDYQSQIEAAISRQCSKK